MHLPIRSHRNNTLAAAAAVAGLLLLVPAQAHAQLPLDGALTTLSSFFTVSFARNVGVICVAMCGAGLAMGAPQAGHKIAWTLGGLGLLLLAPATMQALFGV